MKIIDALKHGFSLVGQHRKMLGLIYLVNLCVGLVFAVPLFKWFHTQVSTLGTRDDLLAGFNYSWWSAFKPSADGLAESIRPGLSGGFAPLFDNLELLLTGEHLVFGWFVFAIAMAYLFIAAFFNGGAIALFSDERKTFSASRFFSAAGLNFHHMAALAATTLIVFALLYKLVNPFIFSIVDNTVGNSHSQVFAWTMNLIAYLIIFDLVFLFTLIFDYAKVIVIIEKKESSWLCIWLAVKFIFSHFLKVIGLNILLLLIAAALVLVGGFVMSLFQPTQFFLLILVVLFQQIFIVAKIGMRLTFYASETVLYQEYKAAESVVKKRKR
jgi:hypothetical protein